METEPKAGTLEAAVRRLRAGGKVKREPATDHIGESEMIRVVSAAVVAWRGQLDRLDRFSLPLLPSGDPTGERASATTTSQLFLEQMASDYRRVALPELNLLNVEAQRKSDKGRSALKRARVSNRSVAPLAVGQYLASREAAAHSDLASVLEPWTPTQKTAKQSQAAFGKVLGPLVRVALDQSQEQTSLVLPDWSSRVGDAWCKEFLVAGSEILKDPSLLSSSQIEGRVAISSREGLVDATETINNVVALAEAFRPVEDVRVSGSGNEPKIDLVLSGDSLEVGELRQFYTSVQDIPADVMILPANFSGEGTLTVEARAVQPDELEP
jgi:hypothetical protein